MITKQYLLPMTLLASISIGLTACGGGGSSTPSVEHKFDGTWAKACEYDASIPRADRAVATIDGNVMTI